MVCLSIDQNLVIQNNTEYIVIQNNTEDIPEHVSIPENMSETLEFGT